MPPSSDIYAKAVVVRASLQIGGGLIGKPALMRLAAPVQRNPFGHEKRLISTYFLSRFEIER
jgi:hypothetical protein